MSAKESVPRKSAPPMRIRFGLRFKIILGLTLFNLLGTAVFAWNHYRVERASTIDGIEQKLAAAARALPDMLPQGYLDRAVSAQAIAPEEYRRVLDELSSYCDDTGLIYLSDHGESLGEGGLYLHGVPYAFAPDQQTRVPMVAWLSPALQQRSGVRTNCLRQRSGESLSHDNLFHTVLGLMDVSTGVHNVSLDAVAPCKVQEGAPQ